MKKLKLVAIVRDLLGADWPIDMRIGSEMIMLFKGNQEAITKHLNDNDWMVEGFKYEIDR